MNNEATKKVRHAKRVPSASSAPTSKDSIPMEIANEKMLALLDIMRMESYPGEDGEQPQFQDETSAARSMELILKENESEVKDTFVAAEKEEEVSVPQVDLLIPRENSDEEQEDVHEAVFPSAVSAPPTDDTEEDEDEADPAENENDNIPLSKGTRIAILSTAAAFALALLSIVIALFHNDTVSAYEVSIGGKALGYVDSKQAITEDYNDLLSQNKNVEAKDILFTEIAVPAAAILTDEEQTELLYTIATEGYVQGYTVTVDGKAVAAVLSEATIQDAIDTLFTIRTNGTDPDLLAGGTLKCASDIQWEYGYVSEHDISDGATLISILGAKDCISYVIERTATVPEVLRYVTEYRENDEDFDGITTMISMGKNGIASTEYLQTVDPDSGEVLTSVLQKTTVIEAPVNAVSYYGEFPLLDESVCTDTFIFPLAEPEDNIWVIGTQVMSMPKIYLSSGYGERTLWGRYDFHLGYDIAALRGTEILACDGGIAVDVGYSDSYGYFVRLQHRNGVETMYAHMSKRLVKEGEYVKQGQVIGLVGATGNTSGNHLHIEFRKNHVTCDPAEYLDMPDWVLLEKDKDKYNKNSQ